MIKHWTPHQYIGDEDEDDIMEIVQSLKSQYYDLGVALKLPENKLEAIKESYHRKTLTALKKVIRSWLGADESVLTWRALAEAVDILDGDNNHDLAKEIESQHPAGVYSLYM